MRVLETAHAIESKVYVIAVSSINAPDCFSPYMPLIISVKETNTKSKSPSVLAAQLYGEFTS